jgi:5-bromo-4-chloroindolyl phosphate hydrolysis protein
MTSKTIEREICKMEQNLREARQKLRALTKGVTCNKCDKEFRVGVEKPDARIRSDSW